MVTKIQALTRWSIRIIYLAITIFLLSASLMYSTQIDIHINEYHEFAKIIRDTPLILMIILSVWVCSAYFLFKKHFKINRRLMMIMLLLATIAFSLLYILLASNKPVFDSNDVLEAANGFLKKDYSLLRNTDYFHRNPHQLGMVLIYQILTFFGGPYNYFFYRVINLLALCGSIIFMHLIFSKFFSDSECLPLAMLFFFFNLSAIFISTFIYGTLISLCFSLAGIYFVLNYKKNSQNYNLFAIFFCFSISLLAKNNAMIFIIAVLICLIYSILTDHKRTLLLALIMIILSLFTPSLVKYYYQKDSGITLSSPVPSAAYIAMGMQEGPCGNGWFNMYNTEIYWRHNRNYKAMNAEALTEISNRAHIMTKNPIYGLQFYCKKESVK